MTTDKHVVIIVALITFIGTVLAAVITNYDKIFLVEKSDTEFISQPSNGIYDNSSRNPTQSYCSNIEWVDIDNDKGIYTGNCINGKPHGIGTMKYISGTVYTGDFVSGHLQGQGSLRWVSGDFFVGEFLGDRIKGKGVLTFNNGIRQEGEFSNLTLLNGTVVTSEGAVLVGTFLETGMLKDGTFSTPTKTCVYKEGKLVKESCVSKN